MCLHFNFYEHGKEVSNIGLDFCPFLAYENRNTISYASYIHDHGKSQIEIV